MQFLFDNDSNLYGYAGAEKNEFEFPTNVKQMGCIEENIKIYMEDYVYTYLYQYAKSGSGHEKIAALVGRHTKIGDEEIVIISGAIQGKGTRVIKGVESFTDETWDYVSTQMDVYFKGLEVIGWMHTQPGFGAFLMARDEQFHKENFKQKWNVLFVLDPIEKIDTFYVYNDNNSIKAAKGYFIYYDNKNVGMKDYMIETNKVSKKKEQEINEFDEIEDENKEEKVVNDRIDAAKKIRKVLNEKAESNESSKGKFAMLTGVCAVLCIACASMGVSLLSSQTRLNKLETEISSVRTSYIALSEQISNSSVTSVFAAQSEESQVNNTNEVINEDKEVNKEENKQEIKSEEPKEEIDKVDDKAESNETQETTKIVQKDYIIEEGDNLGYISLKFYGTSDMVSSIMEANGMDDANKIYSGQKIKLP